ncbi:hypothetical protein GJV03_20450 [Acinetobacter sp. RIT698]|uniref:hypothetical protein n=1 Tax=Acinetobacter sp. RIT698 TaxID=2666192 RepID=UPI0012ACBA5E|nr:hypothetical protein [Acinetobacter sp. RIT698]MRT39533.1 hypothetical protein [Acinetobacter sp. RIT698]
MTKNNLDELKKEIIYKIRELQTRGASCGELNSEFIKLGFKSTNAFKYLISKVDKLDSGNVEKTLFDIKDAVEKLLFKNVAFNDKRVHFYKVSRENLEKIYKFLQKQNEFFLLGESSKEFNYDLLENDLVIETGVVLNETDFKIIYVKKLRNRFENKLAPEKIDSFNENDYGQVMEVKIKVKYEMNAFDFFAFDFKNEHLILGADLNKLFPKPETEKAIDGLLKITKKIINDADLKNNDLRNCVENLEKEKEGIVLNHAFMTAEGGYNHAGNSITSKQDVRNDEYYADGIKNKEADFYGIYKAYELPNDERVVLIVRMTYKDHQKTNVPIRFAVIDGATSFTGLKFALRKVIDHNHN